MTIDDCQFEEGRPRSLTVAAADGSPVQATAELKSAVRHAWGQARHYELTGIPVPGPTVSGPTVSRPTVFVQLNGPSTSSGQAAMDDEARLAAIAADLVSPPEAGEPGTGNREAEPVPGYGFPDSSAGGEA